jgi:hypothetical protein
MAATRNELDAAQFTRPVGWDGRRTRNVTGATCRATGDWQARCSGLLRRAVLRRVLESRVLRGSFRWVAKTWAGRARFSASSTGPPSRPGRLRLVSQPDQRLLPVRLRRPGQRSLREGAVFVPFSIGRLTCYGSPAPAPVAGATRQSRTRQRGAERRRRRHQRLRRQTGSWFVSSGASCAR